MLKRLTSRYARYCFCVVLALWSMGCGSYEIIPSASHLPSSAQVAAERAALAVPPDLLKKLNAVLAEARKTAENERPDPRYLAQSASRLKSVEDRLIFTLLEWGVEKYVEAKHPPEPAPKESVLREKPLTREDPRVQFGAGVASGAALGVVPLGSVGADVAIELRILPNGTYWAKVGRVCGEMVVGLGQIAMACTGVGAGIGASGTVGGAAVGIPLIAESLVIGYNGLLTTANAFRHAEQLAHEGPRSESSFATQEMLQPKPKPAVPAEPAPVAAAPPPKAVEAPIAVKPAVATTPPKTTTKTIHKGPNGEVIKEVTKAGDNVTTTRPKASGKDAQAVAKGAKPGTNGTKRPGNRGHGDHQADVKGGGQKQAESLKRPGETVETEKLIEGHPGVTRRPDNQVVGTDGKTRVVVESERRPNGPYHKKRVKELEAAGIEVITRPPSQWGK